MEELINILISFTDLLLDLLTLIFKMIQFNIPVISFTKDILMIVFAGIGSFTAIYGLKTWRRQIKKNAEFDLARRVLKATYKVRTSMQYIRNSYISIGEEIVSLEKFKIDIKPEDEGYEFESTRAVYRNRINTLDSSRIDLNVELFEAEALWGKDIYEIFKPLKKCFSKLKFNIEEFIKFENLNNYRNLKDEDIENIEKIIGMRSYYPEEDIFEKEIHDAIEKIENMIRPHLKL